MQNVVTVLCPLGSSIYDCERFADIYTNQLRSCITYKLALQNPEVNCASLYEITEWVNLLMYHESMWQRLSFGITDFNL